MIQLFKDKKYWKEMGIILLFGIVINIACFLMPLCVHAENIGSSNTVPYYIDKVYSASGVYGNNSINTDDVNELYNAFFKSKQDFIISDLYSGLSLNSSDTILVTVSEIQPTSSRVILHLSVYVNPQILISINDNFVWSSNQVQINSARANCSYVYEDGVVTRRAVNSPGSIQDYYLMGSANFFPGNQVWNYVQIYNYPLFANNLGNALYSSNGVPIIAYTSSLDVGEFTDLPNLEEILNNISENYTPHTNSTPPTYDSNLSEGENISNAITGHSNNMNNAINNLGENVKNFFNKLYEKLTNVGNKISQNIYNGFSTLMQNIKDFFGPKLDSINDKLGQLVDHISQDEEESQQEIQTALEETSFYQDFDDMKALVTDSVAIWNSTSAPSEYKIPFHVERIAILNCDEVQYIDLSLFSPVFPYLRGVMWALVTYSLVYTVIDSIASYISGGDE